ncbi:hypothetical protein TEA_028770 [Camellia sinensis var. sinensis]|uniref:Uncharacterized protein n=1 Tax=Camellia sinensis var. sinensis TaxID=542762 RepID=A0A4S4EKG7_CAMSN|nr:hypothetical protein TEA_028770 [Camellia sinensis var. sinensis]
MGFLLSNYQLTICILLYSLIFCFSSSAHLCHNDESTALLQFKQSFSFNCSACVCPGPYTDNWKEGTDCCAWDGVTCDNTTSHVIGLHLNCNCLYGTIHPNSSLFNLVHLQHLYLSGNNFNHSQILPSFGHFTNLTHLHLHYSHLSGPIQSLEEEEVWQGNNFSNSIFHLQKLQELLLGGNRELTGKLPSFINGTLWHLRHLRSLDLSEIDFTGQLPNSIGQLEYLEVLRLAACNFSGTIPRSLTNLTRLISLDLSFNKLINGQFPSSIGHLKNLEELYLIDCNFSGTIPRSLTNLTRLISLDLSYNNFEGPIPQLFSNFSQLQSIGFSNNQLTGPIPSSITGLPNLQYLFLGSNSINGTIPPSLFHLVNLTSLDLSSNNLSDTVKLDKFAKLEYLDSLDLSNSGLSLTTTNSTPSSFRNIGLLRLSSCNINKIPEFLKTRMELLGALDLSNNHLNEELNPLCNLHSLTYLDLSNNQFGGLIPTCLGNFSRDLMVLNLQSNNFSGTIPQTFGYASRLEELDISNNGLQGVLPRSLANCTYLETLNVGHNFIEDAFPFWLENLPQLKIIVLRDNKFHGPIPRKRLAFTNLHIIDMSHNEFTGTLPSEHFENMHSMMMDDEDKSSLNYMGTGYGNGYRYYSVTIMNKGLEMTLVRIITIFKAVDFSHNKFDGKIPISIGRLKALRVLNFSRNGFTGSIPLSLVNLTELESLDLSQNKLSGEIPQQLTSLTFLEVFDVSQNNLTGIIPRGQQFETFSNTSYEGNLGLYGFPLSKNCGNVQIAESPTLPSSFSHNFKFKFDGFGWEAVLMGYGCGVLLGWLIGSYIIQRKEEWLELQLSGNRELTGKLPSFINGTLRHLRHLRSLALSEIDFTGELPNSIGQLEYLEELYLYDCNLFGTIPTSLGNLKKLRMLALGGNNFNNGQFPSSISHLKNLEELYLQSCNFFGTIPTSLGNLKKLRILYLPGNNLINGQFPSSIGHLKNLVELNLADCNFSGSIPRSLTYLTRLTSIDLSYNNFEGPIPQLFLNFSQLYYVDFSNNQLTGPIPSSITGLPSLLYLNLGSNSINGTIPPSLFHLVNLTSLDLSSNNLSNTVELDTFAELEYLDYLDLSNSGLSLTTTNSTPSSFRNIRTLRLSSCNICKIPEFLKTRTKLLEVLDLSNNHLNEELNPLCNLHSLRYLNLSNNQFSGLIPTCLGNFSGNLRNNFHGTIPQTFGYASMLLELDISHNGLQGVLPRSLANCTNLEILNLGHNFIEDAFPFWLENLPQLKVVVLRYNKFHGPIEQPRKRLAFTNLHIIDMSHNDFTSTLPSKYFDSWDSMMMANEDKAQSKYIAIYDYYSVTIMNKGYEMEYVKILTIFKLVDFSHNKFHGKIPISIGRLKALCVLNFSRNGFTGPIPLSLVNLTKLESLDLSQNRLSGKIPQELTSLTFLEVFDVSQNNLTGIIPRGQQFETFSNTSYEGNLGLCGFPLSKNCGNVQIAESPTLPSSFSHNFKFKFDGFGWEAVLMGYGCGVLLGWLIGSYIIQRKEEWLVRIFGVKMRQHGKRSKKVWKKIAHTNFEANCTNLEILNVGHNFIEDAFAFWLENLPQLKIIVLRDNKFHGPIEQPRKRLAFTNLHIIDMSHNEFTGTLPSEYFESMHSMMMDDKDKSSLNYMGVCYGYYSVTIMNKGLEMTLVRIITIFKAVDFSHNKFDGKIPISIGRLKALRVLNFSRNGFTGQIPLSLSNLTELESLDLSQNKLSGEIPQQLTSLTFLEVFDVSQNNLTGIIPRVQQFETFSNTSYERNLGLCGFPLSKNCGNVQIAESPTLPSSFSHNFKFKFDGFGWEVVLMGYGCGVLLGLLIGSCIIRRKEEWLVRIFGVKMCQHGKRSKKVWKKIAHTKSIINCL